MSYESRLTRAERLRAQAEAAQKKADAASNRASSILSVIPPGQPILVGHHSERRHRRDLEKVDNAMRTSVEQSKKAEDLRYAASAAESNTSVYADDPNAIELLQQELKDMEESHARNVAINKLVRKNDRQGLASLGLTQKEIDALFTPDCFRSIGVPSYRLSNSSANIRRVKARIKYLESLKQVEPSCKEYDGFRILEAPEDARLRIEFDAKPNKDVIGVLKANGFRWSPSNGAWQRQLTTQARWSAKYVRDYILKSA